MHGLTLQTAPGLCEAPFLILEVTPDDGRVEVKRHELAIPRELKLADRHLHTQLTYSSEKMDLLKRAGYDGDLRDILFDL